MTSSEQSEEIGKQILIKISMAGFEGSQIGLVRDRDDTSLQRMSSPILKY